MIDNLLMDVTTKLCHLLERSDLTDYERKKYQAEVLKLTRKFLIASARPWLQGLSTVVK